MPLKCQNLAPTDLSNLIIVSQTFAFSKKSRSSTSRRVSGRLPDRIDLLPRVMAQSDVIVTENFPLFVRQRFRSPTYRRACDHAVNLERAFYAGDHFHHAPAIFIDGANILEARTDILIDVGQLVVAGPANAPGLLPFPRHAVGGAGDDADRRRVVQQMIAPSFAQSSDQAVTRAIHLED